jgi:predicted exporter
MNFPRWASIEDGLKTALSGNQWMDKALALAEREGLNPKSLERPLQFLQGAVKDTLTAPRSLMELVNPTVPSVESSADEDNSKASNSGKSGGGLPINESFTLPITGLSEAAQDNLAPALEEAGLRMVGIRPLFAAIKTIAKDSLRNVILLATVSILAVLALFGRSLRFLCFALIPVFAGQIAVMGTLGWTGEPLTFLSLVAIPVTLAVSVDTAFNLLNRARADSTAPAKVSRVNAVCAGTTLAGFGGLALSSYKGLQGLGIAAIGGTAVALLAIQWLLPWMLEKWPLKKR